MEAHQAPPSLGFSRQGHWSGCHFLLQCMKVKSEREVAQLCPILSDPMDCSLPGSSVHGIFQPRVLEWGAIAFSGPNSTRYKLWKAYLKVNVLVAQLCPTLCDPMDCSLPGCSCPWDFPGKNTGVGCHSLLQGTFPTQGSNPCLLHCRQILYHLNTFTHL